MAAADVAGPRRRNCGGSGRSKVCSCNIIWRDNHPLQFSLGEILTLLILGALSLHFLQAMRIRELALQAVGHASRRDDFQLLDQSVHIRRISLSRDEKGRWRVWRQYRFDYSYDGVERRQGFVIMLGKQLQAVVVSEPSVTLH